MYRSPPLTSSRPALAWLSVRGRLQLASPWQRSIALLALVAVLGLAAALRFGNLNDPTDNYDEGAYLASLFLMRHGYRPFADINTGEGPLNLHLAYLSYALGGFTLSAARTGTAAVSLLGMLGLAWAGRSLAGPLAGLAAALMLAWSPSYLRVSRWVGPEAMAVAFAALAVGAAAWAYRTDRDRWRVLSGALLAIANLIQASVPMAAIAVGLLAFKRASLRSSLLAPAATLLTAAVIVLAVGPAEVLGRIVNWRMGGQQLSPTLPVILDNAEMLWDKMFRQEQPAFYVLAAVGLVATGTRSPRVGATLAVWLVAQLSLLLCYTELSSHLGVTLLAPLALLAGLGIQRGWQALTRGSRARYLAFSLAAASATIWYLSAVPAIVDRDRRLITGQLDLDLDGDRASTAAVRLIARLTGPDSFVLTDQPYLAFRAGRMVPPELVDPSSSRINAGAITDADLIASLEKYQPEVVVLWTGKLVRLPGFVEVVHRDYRLVRAFDKPGDASPRVIYARAQPTRAD